MIFKEYLNKLQDCFCGKQRNVIFNVPYFPCSHTIYDDRIEILSNNFFLLTIDLNSNAINIVWRKIENLRLDISATCFSCGCYVGSNSIFLIDSILVEDLQINFAGFYIENNKCYYNDNINYFNINNKKYNFLKLNLLDKKQTINKIKTIVNFQ